MKHYLYHVTKKENVRDILNNGLKRKYEFAVYLSENWDSWWKPGMAVLRVRITGLNKECEVKTFLPELDEILVFADICPERISEWHPTKGQLKKAAERYNDHFRGVEKMIKQRPTDEQRKAEKWID